MRVDMNCVPFLLDCVITVLFFLPMQAEEPISAKRKWAGLFCLLLTLPLYVFGFLPSALLRFIVRASSISLYVRCVKRVSPAQCLHGALLCWLTFNIFISAFLSPQLCAYFFVHTIQDVTVGTIVAFCVYIVGCLTISRLLMNRYSQPAPYSILLVLLLCCIEVYIKQTLHSITQYFRGPDEFTVYMVLLQVLFGLLVVIFERYVQDSKRKEEELILAMTELYSYKSALNTYNQEEAARRLRHDMKNHLIALRNVIEQSQITDQYMTQLMDDLSAFEIPAYTGNPILDGLLAEKNTLAQKYAIDFTLQLRKWTDGILQHTDITVIFGNLLDNAIEASKDIPDPDMRSILLKTVPSAGKLCIVVSNYYTGEIHLGRGRNTMPETTKRDKLLHGIGLSSVKHSLEKYGGTLSLEVLSDRRFVATVLIP